MKSNSDIINSQQLIESCLDDVRVTLLSSNLVLEACSQFELKVVLFCADLLRIIRANKVNTHTLFFISEINFFLYTIKKGDAKDFAQLLEQFIPIVKYNIPECEELTAENLLPRIHSIKSITSLLNFISTTSLQTFTHSLLREYVERCEKIEFSLLKKYSEHTAYHLYLQANFIPQVFLAVNTPALNNLGIYQKFIDLCMQFSTSVSGPIRRYIKNLNQLIVDDLTNLDADKIFAVLSLNNEIYINYRVTLLSPRDKKAILERIFSLDLHDTQIAMLWEMRWTIFQGLPDALYLKLLAYIKQASSPLRKYAFSWSPAINAILSSPENTSSLTRAQHRVLPYTDLQKEAAILRAVNDIRVRQLVPGSFNQLRLGAAILCARIMYEMGRQQSTRYSLMNLALLTQILRALGNTETDSKLEYALRVFKGAFDQWGGFSKYSMPEYKYMTTDNVLSMVMLDRKITRRLGFFKSTNLQRYGKSVILSKILETEYMQPSLAELKEVSILQHMPNALYSHLSSDFFTSF